ncbi:MAG: hypothetical protein ACI9DC_004092 [Gammaproteobacteria bacterium]|jgi:hypothetical protein
MRTTVSRSFSTLLFAAILSVPAASFADVIPITGYDIPSTPVSGHGGWGHTYNGTISANGVSPDVVSVFNYTGGSGTLNDGVIANNRSQAHLFDNRMSPVSTLYLG